MYELKETRFFSVRATLWIVLLFSPAIYAQGPVFDNFLLVNDAHQKQIFQVNLLTAVVVVVDLQPQHEPIALTYDPNEFKVFWSDNTANVIKEATIDGKYEKTVMLLNNVSVCDGLAADYINKLLFFTDTGNDVIGVVSMRDYDIYTYIVTSGLDEPRDIVVSPNNGQVYWSDWGTNPRIEKANMDGSDRDTVVKFDTTSWPNGLALDLKENKLYWVDANTHKISLVDLATGKITVLIEEPGAHYFSVDVIGEYLYVTDWQKNFLQRMNKKGGALNQYGPVKFPRLMGIKGYNSSEAYTGFSICVTSVCEHLCLPKTNRGYTCRCAEGFITEGSTCIKQTTTEAPLTLPVSPDTFPSTSLILLSSSLSTSRSTTTSSSTSSSQSTAPTSSPQSTEIPTSSIHCLPTQYGSCCLETCSTNCVNQTCSGDNGRCDDCPAGRMGIHCDTACPLTRWGPRCVYTCRVTCKNQQCNSVTGICDECPSGKTGDQCDQDCLPTQYGSRCVETCSTNCVNQHCTGDNGRCDDCPAGKMGVHCDTTDCPVGMYGTTCDKTCNQNCRDRDCDSLTGQCSVGCVPGYSGSMCQQECEPGKYGTDCSSDCSEFCNTNRTRENESPCHPVSGTCLYGCVQGYQGPACDTKPQSLSSSDSESGVGVGVGIGVGVMLLVAVAVVGVYFYKRRQLAQKVRRERPTDYDSAEPTTEEHNYNEVFESEDGYNLPTDEASSPATLNVTSKTSTHDVVQYVNAEGKAEVNMTPYEDIDQVTSEMDQGKSSKAGENNSGYANI